MLFGGTQIPGMSNSDNPAPTIFATFDVADPGTILVILKGLTVATTAVYHAIGRALELEHEELEYGELEHEELKHEERQALRELSRAVEGVRSDTAVYETLLEAMENDTYPDSNSGSPYVRFIQRWVTGLS